MRVATVLAVSTALAAICIGQVEADNSELPFTTSWLLSEDRAEFDKLDRAQRGAFLTKLYDQASADDKKKIAAETVPKCYSSWIDESKREELEKLHTSNEHDLCRAKTKSLINALPLEQRENVESYWPFCEHVWYNHHNHAGHLHGEHSHHRRHAHVGRHSRHAGDSFDEFAQHHLKWLSGEQLEEVKKARAESMIKSRDRIMELFDASTGATREQAIEQLGSACRELLTQVVGEAGAKEVAKLRESGAKFDALKARVDELFAGVTDETQRAKALQYGPTCQKVMQAAIPSSRRRREHARHHALEAKLNGEWSWLSSAQKEELREAKAGGASDESLLSKVFAYFKTADNKQQAEDGLQTSCGGAVLTMLGPEKAETLKQFMASGAKPEDYEAKVKELLSAAPARTMTKNQEACKSVFVDAAAHRHRRHDHHAGGGTLEDYLSTHLDWLNDGQKEALRKLKTEGKGDDVIHAEIKNYYDATSGETKERATAALKAGCREVLESVIGHDKYEEVMAMKKTGATVDAMSKRVDELVAGVTDTAVLDRARKYTTGCKALFGVASS